MELLRTWLNDDLGLSRPVDSFEADFANGYLIGEVLLRHGLLPNADSLADKSTPMAMVCTNYEVFSFLTCHICYATTLVGCHACTPNGRRWRREPEGDSKSQCL